MKLAGIVCLLLFVSALIPNFAYGWGEIRYVNCQEEVNIRAGRSIKADIVGCLKYNDRVKVDFLEDNWYAVFEIDETNRSEEYALGYAYAPLLKPWAEEKTLSDTVLIFEKGYIIKSQDRLSIKVGGEDILSDEYTVNDNGGIVLPLLGELKVEGKTVSEARELLIGRFQKYILELIERLRKEYVLEGPAVTLSVEDKE
ncbi:MAG: polysaccharide biosynthesis/export family protein [Candidatus Omnitrophota bacterium]